VIELNMIRDNIPLSPRDRILWILSNGGGKMDRSRLRRCSGLKLADLNPILEELTREGRVRITGEMVSLI
jgi:hypothetical protein